MIFIDTGAFVARHLLRDQHHATAVAGWEQLTRRGWRCLTTSFVLDETITLLARRAGGSFAAERARAMLGSERLTVVRPSADVELAALDLLEKFHDKDFSFTDCVSFVMMRKLGIEQVAAFDDDFRREGFTSLPRRR